MLPRRDCSYKQALLIRAQENDDGLAVRAALALGDLTVAMYGGPPPLPAMLLWQCVGTVGCHLCGSVCVGAELVALDFDVVPQWAYGCRWLDALCRGDPAAAESCDLHAMTRVVVGALAHAVAHYADGSERDDVRALVVHRAKQAVASVPTGDSGHPAAVGVPWWAWWWPVGVVELVYFAHRVQQPLYVAAARGASAPLLQALEPEDAEDVAEVRHNAIEHAAASDAVGTLVTLVGGDPSLALRAVVTCVGFGAVRCLEALVTEFGAAAVAAAAAALHGANAAGDVPMLCALPAMPQVAPTLQFLKRCGAAALSAERVAQLTEACSSVLLHEKPRVRPLWRGVACAPALPWEKRLADYDVVGALAAALDVLEWEGDLAAAAEQVGGSADAGMRGLLAVLYDRGVRPTASHVVAACMDGDSVRALYILGKAAPDGVDFHGAGKDASDCLLRLVHKGRLGPSAVAAVTALIAAGAAPTSPSASAALRSAVWLNSLSVAEALVDAGTPIDVPDGYGSALHHAARKPAAVAMLLRRGAAVDARAPSGRTALAIACEWAHLVDDASVDGPCTIALLLDHGASLDDVDGHGTSAEEVFLQVGRLHNLEDAVVADLLQRMHRARGVGVASLLVTASRTLRAAAVRVVAGTLDAAQLAAVGATALLAACRSNHQAYECEVHETMKALLDVVPPSAVHATDDRGCTPLHLLLNEVACATDPSAAVGELLRRGADANAENADGLSAAEVNLLDVGRRCGVLAINCIELLLAHGARCRSFTTLRAIVAKYEDWDGARVRAIVEQLVARGAAVEQRRASTARTSAAPNAVIPPRRRARPTGSSTSCSDDVVDDENEDGSATATPAPRRYRREAGP